MTTTSARGGLAEAQAESYLQEQGLTPWTRNYRCKVGELDLIMRDGDYLVFVEVRLRNNRDYADGLESITASKQRKLVRAAQFYLQQHQLTDKLPCRFDVIAMHYTTEQQPVFTWLRNAFDAY
ncbi:YraN family protein [Marinimicrobium alkaliphilum]|uniref:YraN family protein n=1 Tax=Marinimicrobium alkaliphilum TaxID=2202654 RepID=UPI000DBA09A2|nr:YraN family protein [Marinimicrobium alkaliphilum]